MINVEYLFIRDKNLRDFSYILINIFFNQPALICKHTIYSTELRVDTSGSGPL